MDARRAAPHSEAELLARTRDLAGRTVGEVATGLGLATPVDQKRAKGFVGDLMERVLGATAGSRDVPDFADLGIELKTIPMGRDGKPRESTFVCSIPLSDIAQQDWAESRVHRKLAHVLWLPIESETDTPLAERRIGRGILWRPRPDDEATLRADWEDLAGLIAQGRTEEITAHLGTYLQVRPKAAHARIMAHARTAEGEWFTHNPRGFYLRTVFTTGIVRLAMAGDATATSTP